MQSVYDARLFAVADDVLGVMCDEDLAALASFPASEDPTELPAFARYMSILSKRLSAAEMRRFSVLLMLEASAYEGYL